VTLSKRFSQYYSQKHLETKLKGSKSVIYNSRIKYGISMFKLEILEYCSSEKCIKLEQKHINFFKPEYNILKIAGSSFGRVATDETRAKLAAAMKGIGKGIPKPEETKAKMSAAQQGKTCKEETRAKISASLKGIKKP
jgi:group I intron endonuclease